MNPTGQSSDSSALPGPGPAAASGPVDSGGQKRPLKGTPLRKAVHDLRNHLNIIRNASYLLRRKLMAVGGENVDLVDMIDDAVTSAESVASELMDRAIEAGEPPVSGGS